MSGLVSAAAILLEGSEEWYVLDKVLDDEPEAGDMEGRIIIKSVQEPAVKRLVKGTGDFAGVGRSWVRWSRRMSLFHIPDHAMYLTTRLEVGKDGKTVCESVKGKVASVLGWEFGEKVLFMQATKENLMGS